MPESRVITGVAVVVFALHVVHPGTLDGQRLPAFGGIEVRGGLASPEEATSGSAGTLEADLGYFGSPRIRGLVGYDYFRASIDRTFEGERVGGRYTSQGPTAGLRLDIGTEGRAIPYIIASLNAYSVSASSENAVVEDLLSGLTVGVGVGAGLAYALQEDQRTLAVAHVRRLFANNIANWGFQIGVRYMPRGVDSYVAVPRRPRALDRLSEEELVRREQERIDQERRQPPDELPVRPAPAPEPRAPAAPAQAETPDRRAFDELLELERRLGSVTEIRETERGLTIVLGHELFAGDRVELTPPARSELGRVAAAIARLPEHQIVVEGHSDAAASELASQRLSEQRAEAVRAALIAEGMHPSRVESFGFGQSRPVADNITAEGRARNRRVEITILGARWPREN